LPLPRSASARLRPRGLPPRPESWKIEAPPPSRSEKRRHPVIAQVGGVPRRTRHPSSDPDCETARGPPWASALHTPSAAEDPSRAQLRRRPCSYILPMTICQIGKSNVIPEPWRGSQRAKNSPCGPFPRRAGSSDFTGSEKHLDPSSFPDDHPLQDHHLRTNLQRALALTAAWHTSVLLLASALLLWHPRARFIDESQGPGSPRGSSRSHGVRAPRFRRDDAAAV